MLTGDSFRITDSCDVHGGSDGQTSARITRPTASAVKAPQEGVGR